MSPFLIQSAMTSAVLMLMAALMDRRAVRAGGGPMAPRRLRLAVGVSVLATLPVGWIVWTVAGGSALVSLLVAAALWHGTLYALFAFWIKSLSRRLARGQSKA